MSILSTHLQPGINLTGGGNDGGVAASADIELEGKETATKGWFRGFSSDVHSRIALSDNNISQPSRVDDASPSGTDQALNGEEVQKKVKPAKPAKPAKGATDSKSTKRKGARNVVDAQDESESESESEAYESRSSGEESEAIPRCEHDPATWAEALPKMLHETEIKVWIDSKYILISHNFPFSPHLKRKYTRIYLPPTMTARICVVSLKYFISFGQRAAYVKFIGRVS
jgi:hypothetical protein